MIKIINNRFYWGKQLYNVKISTKNVELDFKEKNVRVRIKKRPNSSLLSQGFLIKHLNKILIKTLENRGNFISPSFLHKIKKSRFWKC